MKRIGLTGTIGSGKSYAAAVLEELGAHVIDTDKLAREVVVPGAIGLQMIVERWGDRVLDDTGALDRKKMGDIVFADERERARLNSIIHPLIFRRIAEDIRNVPADAVVVLVIPLLFESKMEASVDSVWLVVADENVLLERLMKRDDFSREEALARIAAQMPQDEKMKRANVIIDNSGPMDETREQVVTEWEKLRGAQG